MRLSFDCLFLHPRGDALRFVSLLEGESYNISITNPDKIFIYNPGCAAKISAFDKGVIDPGFGVRRGGWMGCMGDFKWGWAGILVTCFFCVSTD